MSVVELAPLVSLLGVMVRHCAPPPHMGVASQQKIFDTVRRLAANDLLQLLANRLVVDSPVAVRRGDNQPFARLINALASECHWKVGKVPPLFSDENEKKKLTDWIKSVDFDRERVRDMTAALLRRRRRRAAKLRRCGARGVGGRASPKRRRNGEDAGAGSLRKLGRGRCCGNG